MGFMPLIFAAISLGAPNDAEAFRPPAVPLVACDPYFSIWSQNDKLYEGPTRHWTNRNHRLTGMVRIDGKAFRIMGAEPSGVPALDQTSLKVLATQSIYTFQGSGIELGLTFTSPALPEDLDVYSRPVTYMTWTAKSVDGKKHDVAVYFDASPEITIDDPSQTVVWNRETVAGLTTLRTGSSEQPVLGKVGDDRRIDWGYLYVSTPTDKGVQSVIASQLNTATSFAQTGKLPTADLASKPTSIKAGAPVLALSVELGSVGEKSVSKWLMVAYDDTASIRYFGKDLKGYWTRKGMDAHGLLTTSAKDYAKLMKRCAAFDQEVWDDLVSVGGVKYAQMGSLAYRQCVAGNKLACDAKGQPLMFPKENTSNGCIATVDVIYPMAPQFLAFSPSLAKSMLVPVLDYAVSPRWKFPFAPHDLGCYPYATAQVYGGGEETEENQMPVEETGNMLILLASLAKIEGNADFAGRYWPALGKWAEYLKAKGFNPENQLCTDDFAGHLAHNVNLSAKAIVAIGCYGYLCDLHGDKAKAKEYTDLAKQFAQRWLKEADAGDHFQLTFDKKDTWSQKYNLVWDSILGLGLFPQSAKEKEMAFYIKTQDTFGLALDSRQPYTKTDWTIWTATLTGKRSDFDAICANVWQYANGTQDRRPFSDWYWVKNGRVISFIARPVIGGLFLPVLYKSDLVTKYTKRDKSKSAGWAPLPKPPVTATVLADSKESPAKWRYTFSLPGSQWFEATFDDSEWKTGEAGFGTEETPGATVRTTWNTDDIWIRRSFELTETKFKDIQLKMHHDEDATVYINGVFAAKVGGYTTTYQLAAISAEAKKTLKKGQNTIAVHCHQTSGGQFIDLGLVDVLESN